MSLPLRVTFKDNDYVFYVLTKGITKHTKEINISLEGNEVLLRLNEKNDWQANDESLDNNPELLQAIGRAIGLRYRI